MHCFIIEKKTVNRTVVKYVDVIRSVDIFDILVTVTFIIVFSFPGMNFSHD